MAMSVTVLNHPPAFFRENGDSKLLLALAERRHLGRFARLALAARKFPETRHGRAGQGRAQADQVATIAMDQADSHADHLRYSADHRTMST